MTARYDDDRLLSAWLQETAASSEPEHLLGEVLARTARTRRRPAWRNPERLHLMSAITSRFAPASPVPWRLLGVAALLLVALAAGLVLVASGALRSPAPPYGLAANGALFFSDGGDLYRQSGPTGARTAIVSGATNDFAPVIAPDGTRLSFLREIDADNAEIWVADIDGSNPHKMDIGGTRPGWFEWSPDGRTAVVVEDSHPFRLTITSIDGPPVTAELDVSIEQPYFRPGHPTQVVFFGTAPGGRRGLYVVQTDGSGLTELQVDPGFEDDPFYGANNWAYFWTMSWSASGDRLLYTTLEPDPDSPAGPGFRIHLATIDAIGNVGTDEILEFDRNADDEIVLAWLPGGDGFVFESVEGSVHRLSVVALGPDGPGAPRSLEIIGDDFLGAQVSPDGRFVVGQAPTPGEQTTVTLVKLADLSKQVLAVGTDIAWQRLAP